MRIGLLLALTVACGETPPPTLPAGRWIDLTHSFGPDTIYWPTAKPFTRKAEFKGITPKGYFYSSYWFEASEHGGTHIDAPIHFAEGQRSLAEIPVDQLIGPGLVISVIQRCVADRDYQVTIDDITAWEARNGRIANGAIVLINTGFHHYWPNRIKYMGTNETGPDAVAKLHFPGLRPSAARWLVDNRRIGAIGLDTPSIDYGQSTKFESHQILFKAQIPAFENVANLDALPATGAHIFALPMKIAGGSGGPVRIVAFLPE